MEEAVRNLKKIVYNMEEVIVGKREVIELVVATLVCRGHILIEDVPGVGKTSMATALAKTIDCSFKRIQFTPDIMPSDITGFSVYNPKTGGFDYKAGAIMSQLVLADEINRTSPKTQSSLLEVMEENQVSVDGITYQVPLPFMVLATQNPVEYLGTYPLPEAQLDRFFMKVSLGYPSAAEESHMLSRFKTGSPLLTLQSAISSEEVQRIQKLAENIFVDKQINDYIVNIVKNTREQTDVVVLGASPRGSICLYKAAQAWAMYNSRDYVIPDDVQKMAVHVLEHRIIMKQEAKLKKITSVDVIHKAVENVKVPML